VLAVVVEVPLGDDERDPVPLCEEQSLPERVGVLDLLCVTLVVVVEVEEGAREMLEEGVGEVLLLGVEEEEGLREREVDAEGQLDKTGDLEGVEDTERWTEGVMRGDTVGKSTELVGVGEMEREGDGVALGVWQGVGVVEGLRVVDLVRVGDTEKEGEGVDEEDTE